MHAERALVSKAAHSGGVDVIVGKGIEARHFIDSDCRDVWEHMREHTVQYGSPPSIKALNAKFPSFHFEVVTDALEYIVDRFTQGVRRREAVEALRDLAQAVDDEKQVARIEELFLDRARALSMLVPNPTVSRFSSMRERIRAYHDMLLSGTPSGVPFGIPTIDGLTLGIQPHELVTVVGWQGKGKSTLMHHTLFNAYMAGKTVLLITLEMGEQQVHRRFDAMATHVRSHALRAGELNPKEMKLWEAAAKRAASAKNDIIVLDKLGKCTVDRVYAEAVRWKPDIIGLDYITLMHTREGQAMWEKVMYITQSLKQVATSVGTPIFAAAQTNIGSFEEGANLGNIAFSRSIGQDSDIVLGLHQDDQMKEERRMEIRMLKNRDGGLQNVVMEWDMETMKFGELNAAGLFARRPVS